MGATEYWFFVRRLIRVLGVVAVLIMALCVTLSLLFINDHPGIEAMIVGIPALMVIMSPVGAGATVRRLHDTGRSAWRMFWYWVTVAGWAIIVPYVTAMYISLKRNVHVHDHGFGYVALTAIVLAVGFFGGLVTLNVFLSLAMACREPGEFGTNRYGDQPCSM